MSDESVAAPVTCDSVNAQPHGKDVPSSATSPNGWIVQLAAAGLAICVTSALTFHYTTRSVFARATAASDGGDLQAPKPVDPMRDVVSLEHGMALYAANCATCHGPAGLGDGPQAANLIPRPRNFSGGAFKLGSTRSGLPTDDDVAATIRHGMLPAMMPPWPQLSDGEVRSLAIAVRHLAVEGRVADKLLRDPSFPRSKAEAMAHASLDPGPAVVLPAKPATFDLARGKVFYDTNCAACHDPDGRGRLRDDLVDNDENPITARDFTTGVFKGGDSPDDLALRIIRGIPGSPMPGTPTISAEDLWSTVAYVKAFAKPAGAAVLAK